MKVIGSVQEWQKEKAQIKGLKVGFAPTMGALHKGHMSLIKRSRLENDITVVSIFVNPLQFNSASDFDKYPSTLTDDQRLLTHAGCDYLFLPQVSEIYPKDDHFLIKESEITKVLCGPTRPGHFEGVATVVLKLLNIIDADNAYFGEKDYQQLKLIKDMSKYFFIKTQIVGCPTVRDESGLALSSRNMRLNPQELDLARKITNLFRQQMSLESVRGQISALGIRIDYLEEIWNRRFIAYFIGEVRLIDNFELKLDRSTEVHP